MTLTMTLGLALCLLTLSLVGCGGAGFTAADKNASDDPQAGKLRVVATTGPVGDLIRRVGGDQLSVEVLMGPGIDPHLYRAVPSDLKKLDAADIIVYNGLHLEGRLAEVLEKLSKRKTGAGKGVIAVTHSLLESKDTRLISPEDYEALHDPHVWHDVSLWSSCVAHVAGRLAEIDPPHADAYQANATAFQAELSELHNWCIEELADVPVENRMMVTAHDAFAYFSKAYGLESVGLKGISTEDEVDLGQMTDVAAMLVERKVPCVFIESAVSPRIVEALVEACETKGHTVTIGGELYADALGPVDSGADEYVGMIRANVSTIRSGLVGVEKVAVEKDPDQSKAKSEAEESGE